VRRQRVRVRPLQVIQARQDRSRRGTLFQMCLHPADPPRRRIAQITIMTICSELGERLAKGCTQGAERNRPAQLIRRPHR